LVVSVVMRTSSWCDCAGLVSQAQTGGRPLSKSSGITRGDRRPNARKARLRALVPHENAVAGLDLGEKKQALAVTGGDGQVLARRSP
jgi:transposase